jgi:hypothetical protein
MINPGYTHPYCEFGCDVVPKQEEQTTQQQYATPAQPRKEKETEIPSEVVDFSGGGGWTRTNDLRIMRPSL